MERQNLSGKHIFYSVQKQCSLHKALNSQKRSKKQKPIQLRNLRFGAGVLGDGLGPLRHGVLGQFSREKKTNGSLDLAGSDGGPLVVMGKFGGFGSNPLENVVDEGIHDTHCLNK